MNTYIVLMRGINVGGKNILPMKDLVAILERMGYEKIHTYIQSGNVVLQSKKKAGKKSAGEIGRRVLKKKGFEPKVLLLTAEDLQSAVASNPFDTSEGKALHFFFLDAEPPRPDKALLSVLKASTEEFKLKGKVFYLYAPEGIARSKLAARVEKAIGVPGTARNWNTVRRLSAMVENASAT